MPNPLLIPIQFAKNGIKNTIQKVMQAGQDPEDATWNSGWGQRTMIPIEDGGLAPKGQDFNGVLYTLSDHAVHRQNGEQIVFSTDVVAEYGGYAQNSIIQSDDGLRHFRSLINNNTFNPNTQSIAGRWEVYAGVGSVPTATSTIAGVMRVINNVTSSDVGAALSAAQGKFLNDKFNFGSSKTQNGFVHLGDSGLILQWGTTEPLRYDSSINILFPIAFPTACLNVTASPRAVNPQSYNGSTSAYTSNVTRTGVTLTNDSSTSRENFAITWFAIGH